VAGLSAQADEATALKDAGIAHQSIQSGIFFRPPADPTPEEEEEIKPLREAAKPHLPMGESAHPPFDDVGFADYRAIRPADPVIVIAGRPWEMAGPWPASGLGTQLAPYSTRLATLALPT